MAKDKKSGKAPEAKKLRSPDDKKTKKPTEKKAAAQVAPDEPLAATLPKSVSPKKLQKARKKARKILAEQPPLVVAAVSEESPAAGSSPARPLVTVTSAVLSLVPDQGLSVVVVRSGEDGPWVLPAAPLAAGEDPAAAVTRTVPEQTGVTPNAPVQLRVHADPDTADGDWVLTVAHLVTVLHHRVPGQPAPQNGPGARSRRPAAPAGVEVALAPVAEIAEDAWGLSASHRSVVERAVEALRSDYRTLPDPHGFLHGDVTLSELRAVHETVGGEPLQPDTFRRGMLPRLAATGEKSGAGRGRPAALYRIQH